MLDSTRIIGMAGIAGLIFATSHLVHGSARAQEDAFPELPSAQMHLGYRVFGMDVRDAAGAAAADPTRLSRMQQFARELRDVHGGHTIPIVYRAVSGQPESVSLELSDADARISSISPFASLPACERFTSNAPARSLSFTVDASWARTDFSDGQVRAMRDAFADLYGPLLNRMMRELGAPAQKPVVLYPIDIGPAFTYFADTHEVLVSAATARVLARQGHLPAREVIFPGELERFEATIRLTGASLDPAILDGMVDSEEYVLLEDGNAILTALTHIQISALEARGFVVEQGRSIFEMGLSDHAGIASCLRALPEPLLREAFAVRSVLTDSQQVESTVSRSFPSIPTTIPTVYHDYGGIISALVQITNDVDVLNAANANGPFNPISFEMSSLGAVGGLYLVIAAELTSNDYPDSIRSVYIIANQHARERMTTEIGLHFLSGLVNAYYSNAVVREIVRQRRIVVVPSMNPMGLDYAAQTNPLWRHNKPAGPCSVDLNRNFPTYYSGWQYSDQYAGASCTLQPTSFATRYEAETVAVMTEIQCRHNGISPNPSSGCGSRPGQGAGVDFVLDVHAFSELVLYPRAYTGTAPLETPLYSAYAREVVDDISTVHSREYLPGSFWNMLGYCQTTPTRSDCGGTIMDYVDERLSIPVLTLEVSPRLEDPWVNYDLVTGFKPPASHIAYAYSQVVPALLGAVMGRVTGRVYSSLGFPVQNATVTVRHSGSGVDYVRTTGQHGEFAVTGLPPGSVTVRADYGSSTSGTSIRHPYAADLWNVTLVLSSGSGGGCSVASADADGSTLVLLFLAGAVLMSHTGRRRTYS